MKRIRLIALFVAGSLTASVFAQPPQGGPGQGSGGVGVGGGFRMPNPLLEVMEKNKDGSLVKAELEAGMGRMREGRGGEGVRGEKGVRPRRPATEDEDKAQLPKDAAPRKTMHHKSQGKLTQECTRGLN